MGISFEDEIQQSLSEWAEIEKKQELRQKKDERLISQFCADNSHADVIRTLNLLEKYKGMPKHDCERVISFKNNYPDNITVQDIAGYQDVTDLYARYLELGGKMR